MLLGYQRVSTLEQAESNRTSLAEQRRKIQAIAMMRDVNCHTGVEFFSDPGVSGTIPLGERPGGRAMLRAANAGDIICASKLDRIFRSASDALVTVERLRKREIKLILADVGTEPVDENGTAKLFFTMLSAFAEFERGRIAERMLEGKRAKAANYGHIGGDAPYGYVVEGSGRQATLIPLEHEQEVVRKARAMKAMRLRPGKITRELNEMGCRDRQNSPFKILQIMRILKASHTYGNGAA